MLQVWVSPQKKTNKTKHKQKNTQQIQNKKTKKKKKTRNFAILGMAETSRNTQNLSTHVSNKPTNQQTAITHCWLFLCVLCGFKIKTAHKSLMAANHCFLLPLCIVRCMCDWFMYRCMYDWCVIDVCMIDVWSMYVWLMYPLTDAFVPFAFLCVCVFYPKCFVCFVYLMFVNNSLATAGMQIITIFNDKYWVLFYNIGFINSQ